MPVLHCGQPEDRATWHVALEIVYPSGESADQEQPCGHLTSLVFETVQPCLDRY